MTSKVRILALALSLALLTACGAPEAGGNTGGQTGAFQPGGPVNVVVHTGPGGGSDVFARAITDMMRKEGVVQENWPVRNQQGGSGAAAMAYMNGLSGKTDTVAAVTPTWMVTPLTNKEAASISLTDMTPIAQLVTEPQVMAVRADSEYKTAQDFIAAAKANPKKLIQTGGSPTAADAVAAEIIKKETGADWGFLSFEGGGERIAALLGGNADMMMGSPSDFLEQVRAGKVKVIATLEDERLPLFPDAPTLKESGIEVEIPQQFRGIVGPPNMPDEAVTYYQDVFKRVTETEEWRKYAEENALTTTYKPSNEWGEFLEQQEKLLSGVLDELGLRDQ